MIRGVGRWNGDGRGRRQEGPEDIRGFHVPLLEAATGGVGYLPVVVVVEVPTTVEVLSDPLWVGEEE